MGDLLITTRSQYNAVGEKSKVAPVRLGVRLPSLQNPCHPSPLMLWLFFIKYEELVG